MNALSEAEARVSKTETLFQTAKNVYHGFMSSELLEPIVDKIKERFAEKAGDHMAAIADVKFAAVQERIKKLSNASDELKTRAQALALVLAAYKRVVAEQAELKRQQRELEALLHSRFKELYAVREGKNWSYDLADNLNSDVCERAPLIRSYDEEFLVGKGAALTHRSYNDHKCECGGEEDCECEDCGALPTEDQELLAGLDLTAECTATSQLQKRDEEMLGRYLEAQLESTPIDHNAWTCPDSTRINRTRFQTENELF